MADYFEFDDESVRESYDHVCVCNADQEAVQFPRRWQRIFSEKPIEVRRVHPLAGDGSAERRAISRRADESGSYWKSKRQSKPRRRMDRARLRHIDYLDGWRGLAIALVLQSHFLAIGGFNSGRLGVHVFFVLSGLLMGRILFIKRVPLGTFQQAPHQQDLARIRRFRRHCVRGRIRPASRGAALLHVHTDLYTGLPSRRRQLLALGHSDRAPLVAQRGRALLSLPGPVHAHHLLAGPRWTGLAGHRDAMRRNPFHLHGIARRSASQFGC